MFINSEIHTAVPFE